MIVFDDSHTSVGCGARLTADLSEHGVGLVRQSGGPGMTDGCDRIGLSWSQWDALVAAVEKSREEFRPVPFTVVE